MGTKAILAVASAPGRRWTMCLGCTSDGFENNIIHCAKLCYDVARRLKVLTKFKKRDINAIREVFKAIENDRSLPWFISTIGEASWVSYSGLFDPLTGKLKLFEWKLEDYTRTVDIDMSARVSEGERIAEAWKRDRVVKEIIT